MRFTALLVAIGLSIAAFAQRPAPEHPIVILVSLDGWRWDYLDRLSPPHLKALAARGVRARELVPSFPSLTFPNHYTIVTGLYPEHHGIVANDMWDPATGERFSMTAPGAREARWWGGEPIWVTATREGRRTAPTFWPGSEAAIGGMRPTYWQPFDDKYPIAKRITQVRDWLALADDERPSFITLYFSDTDHAGHDYGPLSPQLVEAAARVDRAVGDLVSVVERSGLSDRTTIVVVSDHGMTPVTGLVFLDDYIDVNTLDVIGWDELLQAAPAEGRARDDIYRVLHNRVPHVSVYKKEEVPAHLHYRDNPRIAPIVGVPDPGWVVTTHARERKREEDKKMPRRGAHGYDPRVRDMHALFVAAGAGVKRGLVVQPFANIDVYDFLCAVLDVTPAKNDGNPAVTRPLLMPRPQRQR